MLLGSKRCKKSLTKLEKRELALALANSYQSDFQGAKNSALIIKSYPALKWVRLDFSTAI